MPFYTTLSGLFQILPAYFLVIVIFRKRLRCSLCSGTYIVLALTVLDLLLSIFLCSEYNSLGNWQSWYSVLNMITFSLLCVSVIRATPYQIIFILFVIRGYLDNIMLISKMIENNMLSGNTSWGYQTKALIATGIVLLLSFPLMLLFAEKLLRPMLNTEQMSFWHYLWILPICFYSIYRLGIYPNSLKLYDTAERDSGELMLAVVWNLVILLCYMVILQMLVETAKTSKLQEKLHISKLQMVMHQEQYETLQSGIEEASRIRHDLRHHLLALLGYAKNEDPEGAEEYISTLLCTIEATSISFLCENYAVSTLVGYYKMQAENDDIDVEISIKLPQELSLPESELCIVLGNLIENGMEACRRQTTKRRFLQIKAAIVGNEMIAITVKNSYEGEIRRAGEAFLSSKRPGEGIGIASVCNIVEHNGGVTKFEYEDGNFQASVLLNPESASKSTKKPNKISAF